LAPATRVALLASVACVIAVALVWYGTLPRVILMGDDAWLVYSVLHGQFALDLPHAFGTAIAQKYRPVFHAILGLIVPVFRTNFGAYEALNLFVEMLNAAVLAGIVYVLGRRNMLLAFAAAIAFVVCRFGYYNVIQVFGLMEGLGVLFMLLTVFDAARSYVEDRLALLARSILWYALAAFTHERYMVLGLFVVACIALHPQARAHWRRALALAAGALGVLVFNVGLKIFVFHMPVLMGTAGEKMSAKTPILAFFIDGLENVFGFNVGPDYLAAKNIETLGLPGYVVGALVAVPALIVFGAFLTAAIRSRSRPAMRGTIVGLTLFVTLLATASVTIRQEFRWLYGPEAVFFIGVATAAVRINRSMVAIAVFTFAASVAGALVYRPYVDNVFFVYSMGIASDVRNEMIAAPTAHVTIADHGDTTIPNWVFMHGEFFSLYGMEGRSVRYVTEPGDSYVRGDEVISVSGSHAVPVNFPDRASVARPANAASVARPANAASVVIRPFPKTVRSFTQTFADGRISSRAKAQTPTGTGAFVFPWHSKAEIVSSLTVIATYRYTYTVSIGDRQALAFYAARAYNIGSPTRAFVTVTAGGKTITIYDALLEPAAEFSWRRQVIDLSRFAGRRVEISFGADSPNGDQSAAWIAFANPSIITR